MTKKVLHSISEKYFLFKMLAFKIELILSLFALSEQFFCSHVDNVFKANFQTFTYFVYSANLADVENH